VKRLLRISSAAVALGLLSLVAAACGDNDDASTATATGTSTGASATAGSGGGRITVYSGRSEALVAPVIEMFEEATGINVSVKYGSTTELAALLAEEGGQSPADVYFSQDAGALGAVEKLGLLEPLGQEILDTVDPKYRSATGEWVGITARARVLVYNPDLVDEADLPDSLDALMGFEWKDRVGWAPTNGSFQSQITAMRLIDGDDATESWLRDMKTNGVREYPGNGDIVSAVAAGEIAAGLVNHYYVWGFVRDQGDGFKAKNHYMDAGGPGALVNVAGAGILKSSGNKEGAAQFIAFLLGEEGQTYFSEETFEYPLATGVDADDRLVPLDEIDPPDIDLSDIDDLEGTLEMLRETGVLP
jgi:iron(III) transport system substrate-binding protein